MESFEMVIIMMHLMLNPFILCFNSINSLILFIIFTFVISCTILSVLLLLLFWKMKCFYTYPFWHFQWWKLKSCALLLRTILTRLLHSYRLLIVIIVWWFAFYEQQHSNLLYYNERFPTLVWLFPLHQPLFFCQRN